MIHLIRPTFEGGYQVIITMDNPEQEVISKSPVYLKKQDCYLNIYQHMMEFKSGQPVFFQDDVLKNSVVRIMHLDGSHEASAYQSNLQPALGWNKA